MKNLALKFFLMAMMVLLSACGAGSTPTSTGNSANTNLEDLVLSEGVTLTNAFKRGSSAFTATAPNDVSTVIITPYLEDNAAKVTVNEKIVESGTASLAIPLDVGDNAIQIVVTAQDGATRKTYSLVVTRLASSNANLAGLTMTPGSLDQTFLGSVTEYSATVPFSADAISLTATTESDNATITVKEEEVTSGHPTSLIGLNVGSNNIINIIVTAQDGTKKTYSLAVTRLAKSATNNNANLSDLVLSTGKLNPVFDSSTLTYSATVGSGVSQITVTPTVEDSGASVIVNGAPVIQGQSSGLIDLLLGANTVNITVLASDGYSQKNYAINVIRQFPNDAALGNLTLSHGVLSPGFNSAITHYTVTVENSVNTIQFTPTATDSNATIKVGDDVVPGGTHSPSIVLDVGENTLAIDVTAQDNSTTKTYTLVVNRQGADNVDMLSLAASSGVLTPGFSSDVTNYSLRVPANVSVITFSPTLADATANVSINGVDVVSSATSEPFTLSGTTDFYMDVTSVDEKTRKTYKVSVTREGMESVDLAGLSLTTGSLSLTPKFSPGTLYYTAQVPYNTSAVKVIPTLTNVTSTVTVDGAAVDPGNPSQDIALKVGDTKIAIVVTGNGGTLKRTYMLTVTRHGSSDPNLQSLTLSAGDLTPAFDPFTVDYTVKVGGVVTSTIITPLANDADAKVTVNGLAVAPGSATDPINLPNGITNFDILVTAEDGSTKKTYRVALNRPSPNNANLSSIALSQGSLSPAFMASETQYTVTVGNEVESITVTADTEAQAATMMVSGVDTVPGTASDAISLSVGVPNVIDIYVTAEDGKTTKLYQVEVIRQPGSDAQLKALSLSTGELDPVFSSAVYSYSIEQVPNEVTSILVTPTANHWGATITVNDNDVASGDAFNVDLNTGSNLITVNVTAQDGTNFLNYAVTVNRAKNSNNDLSDLQVSGVTLSPEFNSSTQNYFAKVSSDTESVIITPTVAVNSSAVTLNNGDPIKLEVGDNVIDVVVTAENTTTKTYHVNIHRLSNNANLSNLVVSNLFGSLTPGFDVGTTSYTANVGSATDTVTVTPNVAYPAAKVEVNNIEVPSGSASGDLHMNVGDNLINVKVTAEDGVTTKSYQVTVHRISDNAELSNLQIDGGAVSIGTFDPATLNYVADVGADITTVTITPTVADDNATVTVNDGKTINLSVGDNVIDVMVTAEDLSTKTYQVTIHRLSSNADLRSLDVFNLSGSLTPGFDARITSYTANVGSDVSTVNVTPTVEDSTATIEVNNATVESGTISNDINLNVGDNVINIIVTAEDGATKQYQVTVHRFSDNANLNDLQVEVNGGTLDIGTFDSATLSYSANVSNATTSVTITPTVVSGSATVVVNDGKPIDLIVGDNAIKVVVTAEDTTTTKTYQITIHRLSNNADLSGLFVTNLSSGLSPGFDTSVRSYSADVGSNISSVTVTPTVAQSAATVKVNNILVNSGSASGDVTLNVGDNTINVLVIAEDGTTKLYQVTLHRLSDNKDLSNLQVDGGAVSIGAFNAATLSYRADVSNATTSITITPTVSASTSTVTVGGASVTSASASNAIDLSVGDNLIDVVVTAEDNTTKTYQINVHRVSSNANLFGLVVSNLSSALSPGFDPAVTNYNGTVAANVNSTTITPTVEYSAATVKVNNIDVTSGSASGDVSLNVGDNLVTVDVTAEDGTTKQYKVTVHRLSDNTDLSDLQVDNGAISIGTFDPATLSYSADVSNGTTSVTITPTVAVDSSTVTVNDGNAINLSVGDNVIDVVVTAEDLSTKTYQVNIHVLSNDADLLVMTLSDGGLSPVFDANTLSYTATVAGSVNTVTVTPTVADTDKATVTVAGKSVTSASASEPVDLTVGDTVIDVEVTAEDGTPKLYQVTVHKQSSDASLSGLTTSVGALVPVFNTTTYSYDVSVASDVAEVTVTPTATNAYASIQVKSVDVNSGEASGLIALASGDNTITIDVISEDATAQQSYTLIVNRATPADEDATLSDLMPSYGSLDQSFQSSLQSYSMTVGYLVSAIRFTPTVTQTGLATVTVDGSTVTDATQSQAISLSEGVVTSIDVVVTAGDGTTKKTYTVDVTRESSATFAAQTAEYIKASNTDNGDNFGLSVALSGDTLVVGAPFEDSGATGTNDFANQTDDCGATTPVNCSSNSGAVYVFVRNAGTWSLQAYIKVDVSQIQSVYQPYREGDNFGYAVAIEGDTLVITARNEDSKDFGVDGTNRNSWAGGSGAAYVYKRTGTSWAQEAYLKSSNTSGGYSFGIDVDISGNTVVVGSLRDNGNAGAAYVYVRSGSTWSFQQALQPASLAGGDNFGASVAVDGDTIVVGAPHKNSATGTAYVFKRTGTTWGNGTQLLADNANGGDRFGNAVDIYGSTVAVGAYTEASAQNTITVNGDTTDNAHWGAGAVYIFTDNGGWSQTAYIKSSNISNGDFFGQDLILDDGILIVAAPQEDSNSTVIDGPDNANRSNSGAVYIFTGSGSNWTEDKYLKAPNASVDDLFGTCNSTAASNCFSRGLGFDGDTVAIGAALEDGSGIEVNPVSDDAGNNTGAVYVFE